VKQVDQTRGYRVPRGADALPVNYHQVMQDDTLKTAVVGAGYVGIATAMGLAEQGRDIVPIEEDPDRMAALADSRIPFN